MSAGQRFRDALAAEQPLQIVGTLNAYSALQARESGFRAIYLSGAGVANASHGLPDLGVLQLHDVVEDARRITAACDLPLLVDIDTGYGNDQTIARAVRELVRVGVAAAHIEDQVDEKRCGHRPGKRLVSIGAMKDRIRAACDARGDSGFYLIARSDALAVEGMGPMLDRIQAYVEAGADAIFAEAMGELDQYRAVVDAVDVPVLANMTEFGKTPLFTLDELHSAGVAMALYPLSAFRAMSRAARDTFRAIRGEGTQRSMVDQMETRDELYSTLDYREQERLVDASTDREDRT